MLLLLLRISKENFNFGKFLVIDMLCLIKKFASTSEKGIKKFCKDVRYKKFPSNKNVYNY